MNTQSNILTMARYPKGFYRTHTVDLISTQNFIYGLLFPRLSSDGCFCLYIWCIITADTLSWNFNKTPWPIKSAMMTQRSVDSFRHFNVMSTHESHHLLPLLYSILVKGECCSSELCQWLFLWSCSSAHTTNDTQASSKCFLQIQILHRSVWEAFVGQDLFRQHATKQLQTHWDPVAAGSLHGGGKLHPDIHMDDLTV